VLFDRLSQRRPSDVGRGQPRDWPLRIIVYDQRGKQPADIPGGGYLARTVRGTQAPRPIQAG
jgi:hypothetical protein